MNPVLILCSGDQLWVSTPRRRHVLFDSTLVEVLIIWISLGPHHGSYIHGTMSTIHCITFSSIHDIAILRLLVIDDAANSTNGISWGDDIYLSMGLFHSIALEDASLIPVSAHEGRLT